jgi:tetratricopeptide (TPR) repeat protein
MPSRKKRSDIPGEIAARVLFCADRTCCVCQLKGKSVQIHHIDGNASNHDFKNLAVLCFDCHRETQIRGGFDRKLDAEQIVLYRDDWNRLVARQRGLHGALRKGKHTKNAPDVELVTSIAETYRETRQHELLAVYYHCLGNPELRDKYIDLALQQNPSDYLVVYLRGLQARPDLIPCETIDRVLAGFAKLESQGHPMFHDRARLFLILGRKREAAENYVRSALRNLEGKNPFAAAYYLREMYDKGLVSYLFEEALRDAKESNDLWWQTRALQELGWTSELHALVLEHEKEIRESGNLPLDLLLADAKGDKKRSRALRRRIAETEGQSMSPFGLECFRRSIQNKPS